MREREREREGEREKREGEWDMIYLITNVYSWGYIPVFKCF